MKSIVLFLLVNNASAMTFDSETISKLTYLKATKMYEVVITNKAAFYKANEKLLPCLQKGLKEKVKLEIDPMKLVILKCE